MGTFTPTSQGTEPVRTLLNLIWLVFAGVWLALLYVFAGVLISLTIIGIPFGVAAFRMAGMALWPFGRQVVKKADTGVGSTLLNVLWFVLCGWWLALAHLIRRGARDHDHRHPARGRRPQAAAGLDQPVRTGDRAHRPVSTAVDTSRRPG